MKECCARVQWLRIIIHLEKEDQAKNDPAKWEYADQLLNIAIKICEEEHSQV